MELALSLGDTSKSFAFLDKPVNLPSKDPPGFCIAPGKAFEDKRTDAEKRGSSDPPVQLDLLPFTPVLRSQPPSQLRIPWLTEPCNALSLFQPASLIQSHPFSHKQQINHCIFRLNKQFS